MSKKSEFKSITKGLESLKSIMVDQPNSSGTVKFSVGQTEAVAQQSEATFWRQRIRNLENEIKAEAAKRIAAENALQRQMEKLRQLENKISIIEGEKSISRSGRLKDEDVKRTAIYRSLETTLARLQTDNNRLKELFEQNRRLNDSGKFEIQKQFAQILSDALLPEARREYYKRLIQEIDTSSLKVLLGNMNFSDDQDN